jgi:carbon monoxide dehydrogenase subunit G
MSIHFSHTIDVGHEPKEVFAVLDDFAMTPKWLERCTGIEKLSPGPNAVGMKLRYSYKEGGRTGTMDGEIVARIPDEQLTFRYADKMMDVAVDFHVTSAAAGARLTHTIDITPKNVLAKVFAPFIRRGLPRQTIAAMESLRTLLDQS